MDKETPYNDGNSSKISNNDYHPYDETTCVKKTKSDDSGTIVLIIGIASIILSVSFSIFGLILGILAIVLGSKNKQNSRIGTAGWVLGIIATIISPIAIILYFIFF
ncbi:MAG: hypothetical protein JJE21_09640 [Spirochaetaceae bacterium]|nr:hypothetical protein [Spirochaetaceae bacterium]